MDGNQGKRQMILQAYVRRNGAELPMDLIGLSLYYNNVMVYLLTDFGEGHFKIPMNVLVDDMKYLSSFWTDST